MDEDSIFIVGANGQLGRALHAKYPSAKSADIDDLDITDTNSVNNFDWSKIRTIINAAAFTNVDGAEISEGRIAAWNVNAVAVANLVKVAMDHDITIIHVSTEYVFDGTKTPHEENEKFSPLGVYGQTKAAADIALSIAPKHYIVRTSWVIGDGNNFVRTMLKLGSDGVSPAVVSDQIGRLTFTSELVRAIDHLLSNGCDYGTYNISNDGEPKSWADITRNIFKYAGFSQEVKDTTTSEYFASKENVSPRPLQSALDLTKIKSTGFTPRDWRDDLKEYIEKELA